jgi:hypothetical protein
MQWMALAILIISLGVGSRLAQSLNKLSDGKRIDIPALFMLDKKITRLMALGYNGVLDNIVAIWNIQLLNTPYPDAERLKEVIRYTIRQAPQVESSYLFSCFTALSQLQDPSLCEDVGMTGLKAFPRSWRISMMMGFLYMTQLNDVNKAVSFYAMASKTPEAPDYVQGVVRKLMQRDEFSLEDLIELENSVFQLEGGKTIFEYIQESRQ